MGGADFTPPHDEIGELKAKLAASEQRVAEFRKACFEHRSFCNDDMCCVRLSGLIQVALAASDGADKGSK